MVYDQSVYDVRFEWGPEGVRRLARDATAVVIVDVLTFSTAVDVAVGRGAMVIPFRVGGEMAGTAARELGALLAVPREHVSPERPYSLSPGTLAALAPGDRLLLPSPNGATLTLLAAESGAIVFAGCPRNAGAVAAAAQRTGSPITIIAAGERWDNDTLRPAVEDLIGAGAIIASLRTASLSPEARAALAAFESAADNLPAVLAGCSSGRELIERGYAGDVAYAAQLDVSDAAPVLRDGAYGRGEDGTMSSR
jgi:2-phosphosulfolactate phosphatase